MKAIRVPPLTDVQSDEHDRLYRTTKLPRLRTRAQMVLLSAERGLKVAEIAAIVRESEDTVARWLKRYLAEGLEGV
jgi:transposase